MLKNPPVLAYADYQLPFKLHIDACCTGLGAVLYQTQAVTDSVVAYASRSLKPSENNYPAHKLEFFGSKMGNAYVVIRGRMHPSSAEPL